MLEELDNRTLDQKEKILMVRLCLLKEKFNDLKPYYHKSCFKEFYRCKTRAAVGRPITDDTAKVVSYVVDYILENKDECQFSLNEILKDFDGDIPSFRNINEHLLLQFNEEIQTYFFKKDLHIIYRGSIDHVLNEEWYKKRKENSDEERLRVCTKAANIMLDDVLKTHYDVTEYKSSTNFLKDVKNDIPQTLLTVLEVLLTTNKRSSDEKKNKK